MHWGFLPCSSGPLLANYQCTVSGWICFTICWCKSAWEEGRVRKPHLNLLHNPALTSFFLLPVWTDLGRCRVDGYWLSGGGWQTSSTTSCLHTKQSLSFLFAGIVQGTACQGALATVALNGWVCCISLPAPPPFASSKAPSCKVLCYRFTSHCRDYSGHLKIILGAVIPLIITSLEENQVPPCPSR